MLIDISVVGGYALAIAIFVVQEFRQRQAEHRQALRDSHSQNEIAQLRHDQRAIASLATEYRLDTSVTGLQAVLRSIYHYASAGALGGIEGLPESLGTDVVGGGAVLRFEAMENVSKVYLFSRDLKPDIDDDQVRSVVLENLKRGVTYTYLYEAEKVSKSDLSLFVKKYGLDADSRKALVVFMPLSVSQFPDHSSAHNIILYEDSSGDLLSCFVQLTSPQRSTPMYWEKQSSDSARKYREHLMNVLSGDEQKSLPQ